jgi:hypothetical protein
MVEGIFIPRRAKNETLLYCRKISPKRREVRLCYSDGSFSPVVEIEQDELINALGCSVESNGDAKRGGLRQGYTFTKIDRVDIVERCLGLSAVTGDNRV